MRGLAGLGEHAQGLVQTHRVALGGIELVSAVPRRQKVREPQHHRHEDDDTTAENLPTHGVNGKAETA